MAQRVLDVLGLTKAFGSEAAIRDVTLHLDRTEVISLLGPSGCGKTTTLRCIAGFYSPDGGTIEIGGRRVAGPNFLVPPEDRGIAMVFQNYVLWPHLTVFANVAYGLRLRRVPKPEIHARVGEILGLLGLGDLAGRYPHQLSGGQQQRVSVARSIVVRPEVLLLDEPFSNLDAKLRVQMRQDLRDLFRRLGISAVYVTHDQEEAMVVSDRILLMSEGRVVEEGTPVALFARPRTALAADFFGVANMVPGRLRRVDGGWVFDLDDVTACVALPHLDGQDGKRYLLGLRPDDFEVRPTDEPAQGWIAGSIRSRYYVGRAVELEIVCVPGLTLRCSVRGHGAIDWPERVGVRIVADRATLLPAASLPAP